MLTPDGLGASKSSGTRGQERRVLTATKRQLGYEEEESPRLSFIVLLIPSRIAVAVVVDVMTVDDDEAGYAVLAAKEAGEENGNEDGDDKDDDTSLSPSTSPPSSPSKVLSSPSSSSSKQYEPKGERETAM